MPRRRGSRCDVSRPSDDFLARQRELSTPAHGVIIEAMPLCSRCSSHYDDHLTVCPSCGEAAETLHRPEPRPRQRLGLPAPFTAGTMINARYRVISRIGHGAMGDVYRAEDVELHEEVALKFLPESLRNEVTIDLLRNEVRLARTIAHPNVCRVFDIAS